MHEAEEKASPRMRRAVMVAAARLRTIVDVDALEEAIASGKMARIREMLDRLPIEDVFQASTPILKDVFVAGGKIAADMVPGGGKG